METIRIKADEQETICRSCGYPLYVGERAMLDNGSYYCSRSCAAKAPLELLKMVQENTER